MGAYTNTTAKTLDVVGTTVYVCDGLLRILSASSPASLTEIGGIDLGNFPDQIRVAGGFAFVAFGREGFKVVAVSNPSSPVVRATVKGVGRVNGVAITGNVALTGNDGGGMDTVDVSNPARPVALGHIGTEPVSNIAVLGNTAVLVNYGDEVVSIVDVAQPAMPVLRSTYTALNGWDPSFLGANLVLAGSTRESSPKPKINVLNISNPASPQSIGSVQLSTSVGSPSGISFSGNWGFVTRPNQSLDIVDFTSITSPQLVGQLAITGFIHGAAASGDGNYVYVADSGIGVHIVDVRSKSAPAIAATFDPPQSSFTGVNGVRVVGTRLYVSDSSWVYIYDISDPAVPVQVAYYDMPRVSGYGSKLDVVGDLICVASDEAGLSILKVKDLDKPTISIALPTNNTAFPTTSALISLGGTATDLQGVVRVTWENDRGGGGVAQGTSTWAIPNLQLAAGVNVLTVTAEDAQGNLARDSITVTATLPETDGPALLVTGPQTAPAFTFPADTLPLAGTAADVSGVQSVAWANDRGGSGTATGTMAWSADIPLFDGPNRITITARATVGNESHAEVLVTYLPPDTTAPTVGITFPTDAQEAATTEPQVNLSGEADDDRAVARVTWANNRGGSGEAIGGRAWHANGIVLQPGVNVITVTAEDAAGNAGTDTLAVTFTSSGADPARPVLAVHTPGTKPVVTEANLIACAGQASGGSAIVEVAVQVNGGPWLGATGTGNWTADVPLTPGRNVIRFKAADATGRESLPAERVVTYRKLAPLALTTQGEGSSLLTGKPDTAALEVGKLYTADAKPAKGWIFAGWEGAVVSNSKRVSFVMEDGAALRAVFVENPYDELAAVYRGLIRAEPLAHATSGAATLALTKSGAFTAQIVIGGKKLALKGVFDGTGSVLGKVKVSRTQTYDVLLALDTASPDAPVTGLLSDGTTTMALNAWPTTKFDRKLGTPLAGGYTVAVEPGTTAGTPLGFGTGRMTVAKAGGVTFALRLANGTRIAFASAITAGSRVPVYAAMDTARSSFGAPLTFADKPDSDLDGIAFWSSARVGTKTYPFDPFAFEPRLFAQRYTAPAKGERALTAFAATNGAATLTLDDGTTPLTQALTLGTDNKLTFGNPLLNGFKMTLAPAKGEFTGSLLLPANGKRATFNGVLLEKSGEGVGLLLSPDAEMTITLEPTSP